MSKLLQEDQQGRFEFNQAINLSEQERHLSILVGGLLVGLGLGRESIVRGLVLAGIGTAIVHRGMTGHCELYRALGINAATTDAKPAENEELRGSSEAWRSTENISEISGSPT